MTAYAVKKTNCNPEQARELGYRMYPMADFTGLPCGCNDCRGGFTAHERCDGYREKYVERYKCLKCNVIRTVKW